MRILSLQGRDTREMTLREVSHALDQAGRPLTMEFDPSTTWSRTQQQPQPQQFQPPLAQLEPEPEKQTNQAPEKQMTKEQVRERVRAELAKNSDRREASDAWIDARFDRFDADRSGTVDESEWVHLLRSMEPVVVTLTVPPPWGVEMETNHNSALAVTDVKKASPAESVGFERGMVLTSVNGTRVKDAATGKRLAVSSGIPVTLGFDEPEPKKQLGRVQCREMVRIQLELDQRDPNVSDEWIDALFDEFDADLSGLIDDDEWDSLVSVLSSRPYPTLVPEPTPEPELEPLPVTPEPELPLMQMAERRVASPQKILEQLRVDVEEQDDLFRRSIDLSMLERGFVPSKVSLDLFERGPYECTLEVGQSARLVTKTRFGAMMVRLQRTLGDFRLSPSSFVLIFGETWHRSKRTHPIATHLWTQPAAQQWHTVARTAQVG